VLIDLENRLAQFENVLATQDVGFEEVSGEETEDIQLIASSMTENPDVNLIERGVSALLAFHNRGGEEGVESFVEEEPELEGHINIFSKPNLNDEVKMLVGVTNFERFSQPLISKAFIKDKVQLVERVLGRSSSKAQVIADEIIKDIQMATDYPPPVEGIFQPPEMVISAANELVEYVQSIQSSE
jgi:intracellular multiplication protein IcmO